MSSFLVEVYGSVKDYIILDSLLEHLQDNAKQDEQQYVFWFLIANKFYESVKFYAVNDFCHVTELDDRANQYVKYYLMDWLNEYSQTPRPLTADQRKEMEDYIESFNEIIDICVSAEELKQLPFLEGKIDYDELITDYSNVIFHEKPNESYSIQQLKIILCKERADYHQLSQEKAQLQAKIAALSAQLANNGEKSQAIPEGENQTSGKREKGHLITIGLLLDMMTTPKGTGNKPPFQSEAFIIGNIAGGKLYSQSKATLEKRFKEAKDQLEEAKKNK